jgi:hypothetical protein
MKAVFLMKLDTSAVFVGNINDYFMQPFFYCVRFQFLQDGFSCTLVYFFSSRSFYKLSGHFCRRECNIFAHFSVVRTGR